MNCLMLIFYLILTVTFSPLAMPAQSSTMPLTPNSGGQQEISAAATEVTPEKDDQGQIEPAKAENELPDAGELRKRNLGDAFKIFKPSEAISADNAVPFPIDI